MSAGCDAACWHAAWPACLLGLAAHPRCPLASLFSPPRLDHIGDPAALTAGLLQVLGVLPRGVQRDAIAFLPEVATEDAHEVGAAQPAEPVECCSVACCPARPV